MAELPSHEHAVADMASLRAALGLQLVRRYFNQEYWREESELARAADEVEPGLKLENVAAHSWQVADAALLLSAHFTELHLERLLSLAILHDKLELFTGDFDPIGSDGQGGDAHSFNAVARDRKTEAELQALETYLARLSAPVREQQRIVLLDAIHGTSREARFVKAVDKLQALTYVIEKKGGRMSDAHLVFSLRYSAKAIKYFPRLVVHYDVLVRELLEQVATTRGTSMISIVAALPAEVRRLVEGLRL